MGAIWKFFSGEDDNPPASEPSAQRTSVWGLLTGQHTPEPYPQRTATAYHEAGHARAAHVGGAAVTGMHVADDCSGLTTWTWKPRWSWGTRHYTREHERRAELVTFVAGQEAECRYLMERHGYSYKEALRKTDSGASTDRKLFKRRAAGTPYTWEGMRDEAHQLVWRDAYTIETNAKPLDRDGDRGGTWA